MGLVIFFASVLIFCKLVRLFAWLGKRAESRADLKRGEAFYAQQRAFEDAVRRRAESMRQKAAVPRTDAQLLADLRRIGLTNMPSSRGELKAAWKKAMLRVHPDLGGKVEDAQEVQASYERLERSYA